MKTVKIIALLVTINLSSTAFSQCWKEIAPGRQHSVAIKTDGSLWAWGRNQFGQLGDGTTINKNVPTRIGDDNDWAMVDASLYNTIALKNDGSLWCWGNNNYGQIGDGNQGENLFNPVPTRIGTATDWVAIAITYNRAYALKSNGTLWGWGYGQYLGNGDSIDHYVPHQIGTDNNWVAVTTSSMDNLALKSNNTLWGWGENEAGGLGNGTTFLVPIPTLTGNGTSDWSKISIGKGSNDGASSMSIKTDGSLWASGGNFYGTLGIGNNDDVSMMTRVGSESDWNWASTDIGTSFGLKTDGKLWGWGSNIVGQIGDGTLVDKNLPVAIAPEISFVKVRNESHVLAISENNSLYAWGWNNYGQLGDGTFVNKPVPTLIGDSCPLAVSSFDAIDSLRLYPNPAQSSVTISFRSHVNSQLSLSIENALGQVVYNSKLYAFLGVQKHTIDLESYTSGIYFLTLKSQDKGSTIKLIKN